KTDGLVCRRVRENWPVTGGEQFHLVAVFVADNRNEGGKAFRSEILRKRYIYVLQHRFKAVADTEIGARVSAAHRCQNCRPNSMTGHVSQHHDPAAVGQFLPIVEVSTGIVCRSTPAGYLVSGYLRSDFWQKRLLNRSSNLQLVRDLL